MTAGLTNTDNMISVREVPWHRLVDADADYSTREELQPRVHGWEPVEETIYRKVPQEVGGQRFETFEEITDSKGIVRSDNGDYLGTTSMSRGIVLNNDLWEIAEAVQGQDSRVLYETAGSIMGGKGVWILVRFNEPLQIKGDPNGGTVAFFCLKNWHSVAGSLSGSAVNMRVVCMNTWLGSDAEAKKRGTTFTFKHSSKVAEKIDEAKAAVGMWREQVTMWQIAMEHLVTVKVTEEQLALYVEQFHPHPPARLATKRTLGNVERARAELTGILNGETCEGIRNTAYGLAQAGVEWNQHYRRVRATGAASAFEARFKRAMIDDDTLGRDAMALAQEVARA